MSTVRRATRAEILHSLGATEAEKEELLRYNANPFTVPDPARLALPLPDEAFVAAWDEYVEDARRRGAVGALRDRLRQLRFPVAHGISGTPEYQMATRRGIVPAAEVPGLDLEAPDRVRLFLHPTPAGRIPVVVLEHRADFVAVVRAFTRRNEPVEVPDAQGAVMVAAYNNWDRVDRLRAAFERGELKMDGVRSWGEAFGRIRERKELYQDCFVLLSGGPYSGVRAAEIGIPDDEWSRLSLVIRLEHECAHYFTRRVFGSMGKGLLDELIADYAGITAAAGCFRADWFLRFLGLEDPAAYRAGGRLESYRGTPPLSEGAFSVLQSLVRRAAHALENADRDAAATREGMGRRTCMMAALATFTLEDLATETAADRLRERVWALEHRNGWPTG